MIIIKKIWSFLKSYWYVPLLIVVGLILRNRSNSNKIEEILNVASESHKKQLDAINTAESLKKIRKEQIEKEYEHAIAKIEEGYKKKNKTLTKKEKKLVKTVIKEWEDHPDQAAARISNKFGIHYVLKANTIDSD